MSRMPVHKSTSTDGRRTIKKRSHMRTCATQVTRGKGENFFRRLTRGVVGGGLGGSGHGVRSLCFFRLGHETREERKRYAAERPQKGVEMSRMPVHKSTSTGRPEDDIKLPHAHARHKGIPFPKIKIFSLRVMSVQRVQCVSLPRRSSRCSSDSCSRGETRAAPSGQPGAPR